MKIAVNFLRFKEPILISEIKGTRKVAATLRANKFKKPLIVTDSNLFEIGMTNSLETVLMDASMDYAIHYDVNPNPTSENVYNGLKIYIDNQCDSIIAIGGGSAIDCAKTIGALATNQGKTINDLKGLLHVRKKLPYMIVIPTTAGTGSEATIAAVIVDEKTKHKFPINDPKLIPDVAIHDPNLLIKLPPSLTATTGIDALTHAVEAFIGRSNTAKTKKAALEAIKLIKDNLYNSYNEPENLMYRSNMQKAAYLAGIAFTRAYVGYVHAIAHSLGGKYDVPHGLANAIILPYVLEKFGRKAYRKLAMISDYISLCEKDKTKEQKAKTFIDWIRKLNLSMSIPEKFDIQYKEIDVVEMIEHAYDESNPLYPVPKEFDKSDFRSIYMKILS